MCRTQIDSSGNGGEKMALNQIENPTDSLAHYATRGGLRWGHPGGE